MSAKLQSLIATYCGGLPLAVQAIEDRLLQGADGPGADASHLSEALRRVHRIKGAGGSLGFAAISEAAADLEWHLGRAEVADENGEDVQLALASLVRLKQLAASIRPEGSTLFGIDLRRRG